jgi:hypothetical protein
MDRARVENEGEEQAGPRPRGGLPFPDRDAAEVLFLVAEATDVPPALLLADTRGRAEVANARHLAMYLMHVGLSRPMDAVGRIFGRHVTTVSHACRVIEDARDDPAFETMVAEIEAMLAKPTGGVTQRAAA